jgi:hypothetical protein
VARRSANDSAMASATSAANAVVTRDPAGGCKFDKAKSTGPVAIIQDDSRFSILLTWTADQRPPRMVGTPRASSARAMAR